MKENKKPANQEHYTWKNCPSEMRTDEDIPRQIKGEGVYHH